MTTILPYLHYFGYHTSCKKMRDSKKPFNAMLFNKPAKHSKKERQKY